jgi:hypothetical protein
MSTYFRYFPETKHTNKVLKDITKRARFLDTVASTPFVFLPYTVKEGERAEELSYYYYGTTDYVWMVYMANNIVDPYQDWPMSQRDLDKYIEEKYLYNCAECAINRTTIFDFIKVKTAALLYFYFKNVKKENILFYEDDYADVWNYFETVIEPDRSYLRELNERFTALLTDNNAEPLTLSTTTDDNLRVIQGFSNDFSGEIFQKIPNSLREAIVRVPSKEVLKEEFDVLAWTKNTTEVIRNILHYENVEDSSIKISPETYTLNVDNSLDSDFNAADWAPIRVYDYEFIRNENNRHIQVVSSNFADQVQREIIGILNE